MEKDSPRYYINEHSEKYKEEINKYKKKLEDNGLPVIYSLKHFSLLLGIEYNVLLNIIYNREGYYYKFYIKKKKGGEREISAPIGYLKFIQQSIYANILSNVILSNYAMGFRTGFSIRNNADEHKNQEFVLKIDLLRFFDSISEKRVYGMFSELGYHKNLSVSLAKLVCSNSEPSYMNQLINLRVIGENDSSYYSRLAQGSPTSPAISNIILRKLDRRLGSLAEKLGLGYSRYADDLTFSGDNQHIPHLDLIEKIINEEGFHINKEKTRVQKKGRRQTVTGLTVTNGIHVPKKYKEEIKRHLYYCEKYGVLDHLNYLKKNKKTIIKSNFYDWLLGRIFYVKSIEPEVGKKMLADFNKIDWNCVVNNKKMIGEFKQENHLQGLAEE